jgi:hypothetical protein
VKLTQDTVDNIAQILGARRENVGSEILLYVGAGDVTPAIVLTLSMLESGSVVLSAQTVHGYFELHDVQRFVPVEPGEIIFVAEEGNRVSGLVVGREGTCSLFANVHRAIISADLTALEPSLILAAMQLGLTEHVPA